MGSTKNNQARYPRRRQEDNDEKPQLSFLERIQVAHEMGCDDPRLYTHPPLTLPVNHSWLMRGVGGELTPHDLLRVYGELARGAETAIGEPRGARSFHCEQCGAKSRNPLSLRPSFSVDEDGIERNQLLCLTCREELTCSEDE